MRRIVVDAMGSERAPGPELDKLQILQAGKVLKELECEAMLRGSRLRWLNWVSCSMLSNHLSYNPFKPLEAK